MEKRLCCILNTFARCLNCGEVYCKEHHREPKEKCPDRPLYGPKNNGHYMRFEVQKNPILIMPKPLKIVPKPTKCGPDCDLCC